MHSLVRTSRDDTAFGSSVHLKLVTIYHPLPFPRRSLENDVVLLFVVYVSQGGKGAGGTLLQAIQTMKSRTFYQ